MVKVAEFALVAICAPPFGEEATPLACAQMVWGRTQRRQLVQWQIGIWLGLVRASLIIFVLTLTNCGLRDHCCSTSSSWRVHILLHNCLHRCHTVADSLWQLLWRHLGCGGWCNLSRDVGPQVRWKLANLPAGTLRGLKRSIISGGIAIATNRCA